MINLHERMLLTPAGIESAFSRSPEVPRPAINKSIRLFDILSYERIHYTPFNLSQINNVVVPMRTASTRWHSGGYPQYVFSCRVGAEVVHGLSTMFSFMGSSVGSIICMIS